MRAVLQRVNRASVSVDGRVISSIERGVVVLIGVAAEDGDSDIGLLARKIPQMRLFPSDDGSSGFDRSLLDLNGEIMLVSQFTLYASTRKGRRPSFLEAAPPEAASSLFNKLVDAIRASGLRTVTGEFGAQMMVKLENNGPVTIIMDTAGAV